MLRIYYAQPRILKRDSRGAICHFVDLIGGNACLPDNSETKLYAGVKLRSTSPSPILSAAAINRSTVLRTASLKQKKKNKKKKKETEQSNHINSARFSKPRHCRARPPKLKMRYDLI